jgi:hypothetical protein
VDNNFTAHDLVIPATMIAPDGTEYTTVIGNSAFYNCSGLTGALTIPSGVTTIGEYAFQGCSGLTGVNLNNVTSIGEGAFYLCSRLTSVDLNNVTSIGEFAFYVCSGLTGTLTIPNSVTSIGA